MIGHPGASQTVYTQIGNVVSRISGLDPTLVSEIDAVTKYATEQATAQAGGWKPPEAYVGEDVWDGWIHLCRFPQPGMVLIPTGLLEKAQEVLRSRGVISQTQDLRKRPEDGVPDVAAFPLRPYQEDAVKAALASGYGVIDAPPRSGKTRIGLEIHRRVSRPALWMAPTTNIIRQSVRAAEALFGKNYAVELQGSSQVDSVMGTPLVLCTAATAAMLPQRFFDTRAMLFNDEAHHQASLTHRRIADKTHHIFYRYGMTGTFFRSGVDDLAMLSVLSKTIYKITSQRLVDEGFLVPAEVALIPVDMPRIPSRPGKTFIAGVGRDGIYTCEYRNQLVAWVVASLWSRGKRTLVIVGTKEQGYALKERIGAYVARDAGSAWSGVEFVSTDNRHSQKVIDAFVEGLFPVLIGTSMIGEGTDLPLADALVFAHGGKAEVFQTQANYRVCTAVPGKKRAVIVDFIDRHHETLMRHSEERFGTYYGQETFHTVVLPDVGSFVPWLDQIPERAGR